VEVEKAGRRRRQQQEEEEEEVEVGRHREGHRG